MTPRVLVTEPIHAEALALLQASCAVDYGPNLSPEALKVAEAQAQAILVRTAPLRHAGPLLRLVSKHGVGVDNVDLAAMRAAGVAVMNTPGANAGAVAEHAVMLMLALARDLGALEHAARTGHRPGSVAGLEGRRLLVIGFGASGRKVAALGAAMGMHVSALSRSLAGTTTPEGYALVSSMKDALPKVDVLTLHCPLTDATRNLIGQAELAALPQGALVINCARGGLIDEAALTAALRSGHLGGAGLDVTETEPLPSGHHLLSAPRLILTPHAAAMSRGAFRAMGMQAVQNVLDHFSGHPDPSAVLIPAAPAA
ncbi:MAG: NAD(P)-dependent oxidoreductase [Gemmobacter sp.]|nr:NAD(P)-dependent oxidoreductase [Gemmobacter sp.]